MTLKSTFREKKAEFITICLKIMGTKGTSLFILKYVDLILLTSITSSKANKNTELGQTKGGYLPSLLTFTLCGVDINEELVSGVPIPIIEILGAEMIRTFLLIEGLIDR